MDRQYIQKQKRWIQEHDAADQVRLLSGKLPGALRRIQGEFDLILADPPYTSTSQLRFSHLYRISSYPKVFLYMNVIVEANPI